MSINEVYNMEEENQATHFIDMGEIYRQNYLDALDEIRNLRQENADLKAKIYYLNETLKMKPKEENNTGE